MVLVLNATGFESTVFGSLGPGLESTFFISSLAVLVFVLSVTGLESTVFISSLTVLVFVLSVTGLESTVFVSSLTVLVFVLSVTGLESTVCLITDSLGLRLECHRS